MALQVHQERQAARLTWAAGPDITRHPGTCAEGGETSLPSTHPERAARQQWLLLSKRGTASAHCMGYDDPNNWSMGRPGTMLVGELQQQIPHTMRTLHAVYAGCPCGLDDDAAFM